MDQATDTANAELLQALIAERYGPIAATAKERAATPAELIRLPQRRRAKQRRAAA